MVHFGRELTREARPEWLQAGLYLDYHGLKKRLRDIVDVKERPETRHLVDSLKAIFQGDLDSNISKVLQFYKQRARELEELVQAEAAKVTVVLREAYGAGKEGAPLGEEEGWGVVGTVEQMEERMGELQGLTQEVTYLLRYISLNMAAVRKILKKFSKHVEQVESTPGYLTLEIEHPTEDSHIIQGSFLPASVAEELQQMQQHAEVLEAGEVLRALCADLAEARDELQRHASMRLPSQGERMFEELDSLLGHMGEARDKAARNSALVHPIPWAQRMAGMFEPPPPDEFATATAAGLVANNLSTCLYMMNYNAVIPPIDELCVHIGVTGAMAGYIVGASDAAAVFASLAVSKWTNRSFKQPLLFCGAVCLAGNLLFCLSYERRSLWLLLVARLFNGLGSARSANRRYTADYVSRARRTMAAAAFVGASNLGQALGPFLSLPLAALPPCLTLAGLTFNSITAIGWVMAACWLLFVLLTLLFFSDPPRQVPIGLAAVAATAGPGRASGRLGSADPESRQPLLNAPDHTGEALSTSPGPGEITQRQASAPAGPPEAGAMGALGAPRGLASPTPQGAAGLLRDSSDLEVVAGGPDEESELEETPRSPPLPKARLPAGKPPSAGTLSDSSGSKPTGRPPKAGASGGALGGEAAADSGGYSWRSTIPATAACMLCLFVQKAVQQGYLDGVPLVASVLWGWGNAKAGVFLATVGLGMVPVNLGVGLLSAAVSDRSLVAASLLDMLAGLALLTLTTAGAAFYFTGGVVLFVGTVVLEGTATSLMSKVIHPKFARGTWNAGLLSTEAGTLGRFAGNALLSLAGRLAGVDNKQQLATFSRMLHPALGAGCIAVLAYLASIYRRLSG